MDLFSRILFFSNDGKEESKKSQCSRAWTIGRPKRRQGTNCSAEPRRKAGACAQSGSGEGGKGENAQAKGLMHSTRTKPSIARACAIAARALFAGNGGRSVRSDSGGAGNERRDDRKSISGSLRT